MEVEKWRRQTEARWWLKRTGGDRSAVEALLKRISDKRGQAAANQLREDMREAWRVSRLTSQSAQSAKQTGASIGQQRPSA